jgi:hypothetical protein
MAAPSSQQFTQLLVAWSQGEHAGQPKLIHLLRIANSSDTSTSLRETGNKSLDIASPRPNVGEGRGVRGILLCGINPRNWASTGTSASVREFGCALRN